MKFIFKSVKLRKESQKGKENPGTHYTPVNQHSHKNLTIFPVNTIQMSLIFQPSYVNLRELCFTFVDEVGSLFFQYFAGFCKPHVVIFHRISEPSNEFHQKKGANSNPGRFQPREHSIPILFELLNLVRHDLELSLHFGNFVLLSFRPPKHGDGVWWRFCGKVGNGSLTWLGCGLVGWFGGKNEGHES